VRVVLIDFVAIYFFQKDLIGAAGKKGTLGPGQTNHSASVTKFNARRMQICFLVTGEISYVNRLAPVWHWV
jgi:hypothetical protein